MKHQNARSYLWTRVAYHRRSAWHRYLACCVPAVSLRIHSARQTAQQRVGRLPVHVAVARGRAYDLDRVAGAAGRGRCTCMCISTPAFTLTSVIVTTKVQLRRETLVAPDAGRRDKARGHRPARLAFADGHTGMTKGGRCRMIGHQCYSKRPAPLREPPANSCRSPFIFTSRWTAGRETGRLVVKNHGGPISFFVPQMTALRCH